MAVDKLLQRPLYVFDLPQDFLNTLHFQQTQSDARNDEVTSTPDTSADTTAAIESEAAGKGTSCSLCGLSFESVDEQRSHVRSDLHNYNLKQRVRGRKAVTEGEFEKLIGDLDESLSGSDSDDSETDEEVDGPSHSKPDVLVSLLKRQAQLKDDGSADQKPERRRKKGSGAPPLYWFRSSAAPSDTSFGIYRAVFTNNEQDHVASLVESLQRKQLAAPVAKVSKQITQEDEDDGGVPLPGVVSTAVAQSAGPHYFLCMIGGGHFAAMLVSLTPKRGKKSGFDDRSATILAHKTFHRYTTRRKQGGSQSANDNSKGNAHSAGSSLRRYNEVALETDVRSLLTDWKPWIEGSELLFVRATGSTNRRTLFGPYDGQVLSLKDTRLRGFPFNTKRATQNELMRAFVELTRVKVNVIDEAAVAKQAAEDEAKARDRAQQLGNKTKTQAAKKTQQPTKAEEEAILHTTQLQALIRRSKAPALLSYLQTNSLPPDFLFSPADRNHHSPTPLHLAAASNSTPCVTTLLVKAGADPVIRNGDGRTAYELAGDRSTRDAFALARGQLGEDKWQWSAAGVPAAITQQEADARAARDKAEKLAENAVEQERRQAEMQRIRKEDKEQKDNNRDKKFGTGKTLSAPMTAEQRRMNDAKGMTDDMRIRMEREQRARAAEERMRRLNPGT